MDSDQERTQLQSPNSAMSPRSAAVHPQKGTASVEFTMDQSYAAQESYPLLNDHDADGEKPVTSQNAESSDITCYECMRATFCEVKISHKEVVRKVLRFWLLFLLGCLFYVAAFLYRPDSVNDEYTFSSSKLTLEVSACRILLKSGSSSDVKVHVNSPIQPQWYNVILFEPEDEHQFFERTDSSLKMLNPSENLNTCNIEIESANFPDLEIICDDYDCPITQDDEDLVFGGQFDIIHKEDAAGNVAFKRISAQQVFFNVTGTVSIEQLTSEQGGTIHSQYGDVWIQSQQEINVLWRTSVSSAYQFVAPSAHHVTPPVCTIRNITISDDIHAINDCQGHSRTCLVSGCATDYSLDLHAIDGGVYVQLLESPKTLYSDYSVSWRDDNSLISLDIDLISRIKIEELREKLDRDVIYDQLVMMTMAGVNYDIGKWLYTTREAYTQFKPWWMSVLSFGQLVPQPVQLNIRLVPWPAIFSEPIDDDDMSIMGPFWYIIKDKFGNISDQFLMWMSGDPYDEDVWYKIEQDKHGEFSRHEQKLVDNLPLLIAIVFSIVLGAIGGIVFCIVTAKALIAYSKSLEKGIRHSYLYRKNKDKIEKRSTTQQDMNENESDNYEASDLVNTPPPFSLPELFVYWYRKVSNDSLAKFFKYVSQIENVDTQTTDAPTKLSIFKEKYEEFCFVNEQEPNNIHSKRKLINDQGFELSTLSDSSTEVYKQIRVKTFNEKKKQNSVRQIPGEDSLSFFVRSECIITTFETDFITVKDFNDLYDKFNDRFATRNITPPTKRTMASMGVNFERLTLNVIQQKPDNDHVRIDLDAVNNEIKNPSSQNEPWSDGWLMRDIIAVFIHCIIILILLLPLAMVFLFEQDLNSVITTRDVDQFITFSDIVYRPWMITEKLGNLAFYVIIILVISGCILAISLLELLTYYLSMRFPIQPLYMMEDIFIVRKIIQYMFYGVIFFVVTMASAYIVIWLCWFILGAVLNPEVNLPMAAAALVFISFCLVKITSAVLLYDDILQEITDILIVNMKRMLNDTLEKIIEKLQNKGFGQIGAAIARGRYVHALNKTTLGSFFGQLEIDPEMITAIANGDSNAIDLISYSFGLDPIIVEALLAAVTRELPALKEAIPKLAELPGIDLDPQVVQTLVLLAWKTTEQNLRTSVKFAVIQFQRIMNKKLKEKISQVRVAKTQQGTSDLLGSEEYQHLAEEIEQFKDIDIDSRVIEALVCMARGDETRLLNVLKKPDSANNLPPAVTTVMEFIRQYTSEDPVYIQTLIELLTEFMQVEPKDMQLEPKEKEELQHKAKDFFKGIGSLVSENYHYLSVIKQVLTDEEHEKENPEEEDPQVAQQAQASAVQQEDGSDGLIGYSKQIQEFVTGIGYKDSFIVQIVTLLARKQQGTLQRLIPTLVETLNTQLDLDWELEETDIKSLFTMVYGIRRNQKLSGLWNVDDDVVLCFPSLMLCPYIVTNEEDKKEDNDRPLSQLVDRPRSQLGGRNPIDMTSESTGKNERRSTFMPQNTLELEDTLLEDQTDPQEPLLPYKPKENRRQSVCFTTDVNQQAMKTQENPVNPSVDILRYTMLPSGDTMAWFEKQWGIDAKVVMGMFVILRIAERQHNQYLEHITTAVLQLTNLDLRHTAYCTALVKLFSSHDKKTVQDAQDVLKLTLKELSMVARRLKDPKDISSSIMLRKLLFNENDELNKSRAILTWKEKPKLCENWCKETARAVLNNEKLNPQVKFMATGQLLMAIQLPPVFVQRLLQLNCQADESVISAFKTLLRGNYIKMMSSKSSQKNAIEQLSRLFDIPHDQMKAFVNVALATKYEDREVQITKLLQSSSFQAANAQKQVTTVAEKTKADNKMLNKISSIVHDAREYMSTLEENVKNFSLIGKKLGLPAVFIESLCSGMNEAMLESPPIKQRFIEKFTNEFGLKDKPIKEALISFCMRDVRHISNFAEKGLGLTPKSLESAIRMFGNKHQTQAIDEVGAWLDKLGANEHVKSLAQSFTALMAGYNEKCIQTKKTKKRSRSRSGKSESSPASILGEAFDIPKYILDGLLCSVQKDDKGVKSSLMSLCQKKQGMFIIQDSYCHAFIDMARGKIEHIEDIANQIRFETDIAEVLVLLAGSTHSNHASRKSERTGSHKLTHSKLKQSTDFQKFCLKLGLDMQKMAAIIALTKQDIEHIKDICKDLGNIRGFPPVMIKALMSVYQYSTFNGKQHPNYDPLYKRKLIKKNIGPLVNLFGINEVDMASFIIGIAQGNASVIAEVDTTFSWTTNQAMTYGSLVCLFHKSPWGTVPDNIEEDKYSFLAYKEMTQVCKQVGQLFNVNHRGVEQIVLLAQGDKEARRWLTAIINPSPKNPKGEPGKKARDLIKMIINENKEESEDEDEDFQKLGNLLENLDAENDAISVVSNTDEEQFDDDEIQDNYEDITVYDAERWINRTKYNEDKWRDKSLNYLINALNNDYPVRDKKEGEKPFDPEIVNLLFSLAKGVYRNLDEFETIVDKNNNHDKDRDIEPIIAKELLAIASGDYSNVLKVDEKYPQSTVEAGEAENEELSDHEQRQDEVRQTPKLDENQNADHDDTEKSIYEMMSWNPSDYKMKFLMKLANRDVGWINTAKKENSDPILGKIIQPLSLAKAIFGLIAVDSQSLQRYTHELTDSLDLDFEMAQAVIFLSTQALSYTSHGVLSIAERLDVDTATADSFVAMAYEDKNDRLEKIMFLCEKLSINPGIVNAIWMILQGDKYEGWMHILNLVTRQPLSEQLIEKEAESSAKESSQASQRTAIQRQKTLRIQSKYKYTYKKSNLDQKSILKAFIQILSGRWYAKVPQDLTTKSLSKWVPRKVGEIITKKETGELTFRKLLAEKLQLNKLHSLKKGKVKKKDKTRQDLVKLKPAEKEKIPEILVDVLIGIATNDLHLLNFVMTLYSVPIEQHDVIKSLVNLYNKDTSELKDSAQMVEDYIKIQNCRKIPSGLIQSIYGSIYQQHTVLYRGVSRALKRQPGIFGLFDVPRTVPRFLHKMSMKQGYDFRRTVEGKSNKQLGSAASFVIKKFLNIDKDFKSSDEKSKFKKIFYSLFSKKVDKFIKNIGCKAIETDDLLEFYEMVKKKKDNKKAHSTPATSQAHSAPGTSQAISEADQKAEEEKEENPFPLITEKICTKLEIEDQKVIKALLQIITQPDSMDSRDSNKKTKGMGDNLSTLINYFISKIDGIPDALTHVDDDKERQDDQEENKNDEQKEEGSKIIRLLDAYYLSCIDSHVHKNKILSAMPVLGEALLGEVPPQAIQLLTGIVQLFGSEGNAAMREEAIVNLSKAFEVKKGIVQGLVGMAKGDWPAMEEMVARICEFHPETIQTIVQLIKRLRIAKEADDLEGKEERQTQQYAQLKERIVQGEHIESIFNMLDADASGELDFDEFQEALKYYGLRMTKERQLEIFSQFDIDGNTRLSVNEFYKAIRHIRRTISTEAIGSLSLSWKTMTRTILIGVLILLLLFAFIFLGISGFTTNTTLGTVVNSILPVFAGGIVLKFNTVDVKSRIKRIEPIIEDALSALTSGDV